MQLIRNIYKIFGFIILLPIFVGLGNGGTFFPVPGQPGLVIPISLVLVLLFFGYEVLVLVQKNRVIFSVICTIIGVSTFILFLLFGLLIKPILVLALSLTAYRLGQRIDPSDKGRILVFGLITNLFLGVYAYIEQVLLFPKVPIFAIYNLEQYFAFSFFLIFAASYSFLNFKGRFFFGFSSLILAFITGNNAASLTILSTFILHHILYRMEHKNKVFILVCGVLLFHYIWFVYAGFLYNFAFSDWVREAGIGGLDDRLMRSGYFLTNFDAFLFLPGFGWFQTHEYAVEPHNHLLSWIMNFGILISVPVFLWWLLKLVPRVLKNDKYLGMTLFAISAWGFWGTEIPFHPHSALILSFVIGLKIPKRTVVKLKQYKKSYAETLLVKS
jgi:hypothetical protein